jgi:hypothetical protein
MAMLSLDDPFWRKLWLGAQAATLLRRLYDNPTGPERTKLLWETLKEQGGVYNTALAAIPHLVKIAGSLPPMEQVEYVVFFGMAAGSEVYGVKPPALTEPYAEALKVAALMARDVILSADLDRVCFIYLLDAVAVLHGAAPVSGLFIGLCDGEFHLTCPHCEADYLVNVAAEGFFSHIDDAARKRGEMIAVAPHSPMTEEWSGEIGGDLFSWTHGVTRSRGHEDVAQQLSYIFGAVTCPECGESHALFSALR